MIILQAYANYGRWLCECPECKSALGIKQLGAAVQYPRFGCVECGYGFGPVVWATLAGVPLSVRAAGIASLSKDMQAEYILPHEVDEIETELLKRPRPDNRNWMPGETIVKLAQENAIRGIE